MSSPAIKPGVFGVPGFTVTFSFLTALSPQEFLAITLMSLLFPVAPDITSILGVVVVTVVLLLFQPFGKVQIYSAALAIAAME
ncbi:hypothetical protein GCM10023115_26810 [Pontixanthobacter gangjinensis]